MIDLNDVTFAYPGSGEVLKKIRFHVSEGERVGLIGANGSGKTTLMRAILGLIAVQGEITVDGMPVDKAHLSEVRKTVGFVLQDSEQQMFMPTVLEDMVFGPVSYGQSRQEAEQRADEVLRSLQLEKLKYAHNHRLSGGEKKMAAIATILTMQPKCILMDEPTAALDPYYRRKLIQTLQTIPGTGIIASHDMDFILETCDRVLLLGEGRLVADADARTILTDEKLLLENRLEMPYGCQTP